LFAAFGVIHAKYPKAKIGSCGFRSTRAGIGKSRRQAEYVQRHLVPGQQELGRYCSAVPEVHGPWCCRATVKPWGLVVNEGLELRLPRGCQQRLRFACRTLALDGSHGICIPIWRPSAIWPGPLDSVQAFLQQSGFSSAKVPRGDFALHPGASRNARSWMAACAWWRAPDDAPVFLPDRCLRR